MNLFKFLWSASKNAALTIIILSVVNGIAGGLLLIMLPDAAVHIYLEGKYFFYALSLPSIIIIFLISRHSVQIKTEALAGKAVEEMVMRVSNTVRHAELPEFQKFNKEDIYLSIADAQKISDAASRNPEILQSYTALFVSWCYISFLISPFFGLFLLGSRFLQHLLQEMFGKIIASYIREQQQEEKEVFAALRNHLHGFKELKFNRKKSEAIFNNYLLPKITAGKRKRVITRRYGAEAVLASILMHLLTMVCCTSFFTSLAHDDIAKIVIILLFAMQNDMLIHSLGQNLAEGNAALTKFQRLFSIKSCKKADEDIPVPVRNPAETFSSIRIDDVHFSYPSFDKTQGFSISIDNLTINSGEIFFIVGGNGSGKSTFMNVLTGLYPPNQGMITIDGHSIPTGEYRNIFSPVFADFHLFDKFYGIETVDEERIHQLLKLTGLEAKTKYENGKFSTQDLSTGQRKRLALVIAMIEDRPIFIFDEWAADQDPHFRRFFYEDILPSLKQAGKTVIAVTHDDRYFHLADKVIRMEYGQIAEQWHPIQKQSAGLFSQEAASIPTKESRSKKNYFKNDQNDDEKSKKNKEYGGEGMFDQLQQIFQEERDAVKKILSLLLVFISSLVFVTISILHSSLEEQPTAARYAGFILCLVLMVMSYRRLQKTYYQAVENRIASLRINVMDHARKTNLLTLKKVGIGRIYTALTSDVRTVAAASNIILLCFQGGARMALIYLYVAYLYFPAFLMMILFTGIGVTFYSYNHLKLIDLFDRIREQEKKMFESVNHLLDGFKELKLNSKKSNEFYHNSLVRNAFVLRSLKLEFMSYYANNATITYGFWKLMLLIMVLFLPFFGMPATVLPIAVGIVVTMPLRQVVDMYSQFHLAYLSMQRLSRFEDTMKNLDREPDGAISVDVLRGYESVRYEGITFSYRTQDERPFSIGPLNVSFKAGEIVFITGGNGSGKSTLLNVITGLYPADSGNVFLNDQLESDIRLHRELFGTVFTDFHLFDRLYGIEEVDSAKLTELLQRFGLEKKVKLINGKFSTLDLSTGQKKRLALVITILEDKPVYILDEWAADQDPHFREFFYMTLLPEFKSQGKTVLAVTHDDMYFHTADRILHLEYGQLAES